MTLTRTASRSTWSGRARRPCHLASRARRSRRRCSDRQYCGRGCVKRVWEHYLGVGLVEPVDDFSVANPPTNARLLDALARDFVEHGYDVRHLERTILNARTYQLSAVPNATNKFDKNNFARGYVRPMMAEAVVDVFNDALGVAEKLGPD